MAMYGTASAIRVSTQGLNLIRITCKQFADAGDGT